MIIENFYDLCGIGPGIKTYKSDDITKILLQEDTGKKGERAVHRGDHTHTYVEIDRPEDDNYVQLLI